MPDGRSRANKGKGEKEIVLKWTYHGERMSNDSAAALGWKQEGKKSRQAQNNLASHCGEGKRQTRMKHMGKCKTGQKQLPIMEGGCTGLVHLLVQRDLIFNLNLSTILQGTVLISEKQSRQLKHEVNFVLCVKATSSGLVISSLN